MNKIVTKEEFKNKIRYQLKEEGKTIALCHGVYDLVHPGHITHLRQAREMADCLVVSITASRYVRKGPGRPYFDDNQRLSFMSALEFVDYVILSEGYTADDIVENVEPDIYVKGAEYENEENDLTGMIKKERLLVEAHGGRMAYTSGEVFSSTRLINTAFNALPKDVIEFMLSFKEKHSLDSIRKITEKCNELKILVIGDVIIDRYTYCYVQGLISKDMAYSARYKSSEDYLGGALAIARHLSSFSKNVDFMSIIGNEIDIAKEIEDSIKDSIGLKLYISNYKETIIKQRFLMRNQKREEYKKVFAINNIVDNTNYEQEVIDRFVSDLGLVIEEYDVVFLCDFGHGLIGKDIMDMVQAKARFLALNCQTNSSNKGKNIITKYHRADAFSLDQAELALACPGIVMDEQQSLKKLCDRMSGMGWLTRGSEGAYAFSKETGYSKCPAFSLNVKDTIGAGDAFFSIAGVVAAAGGDSETALFLGNIAGALGANIIGNKDSIEKSNVLKYASTLMNV